MKPSVWLFAWAAVATATLANAHPTMTAEEEVRALPGMDYVVPMLGQKIASHLSCISEGGGSVVIDDAYHEEWSFGMLKCGGRTVITLERKAGNANDRMTRRIVDALLLPPIRFDGNPRLPNTLRFADANECLLKGRPNTYFFAVVSWGNRERLDWRHGVKQAWIFDIKQGRIVPLDTRNIVCEWIEP